MNYIFLQQRSHDNVKYITDDLQDYSFVKNSSFFEILKSTNFSISEKFLECFDRFDKILIDVKKNTFEIQKNEHAEYTMQELITFNDNVKNQKNKMNIIDKIHNKKKEKLFGIFKSNYRQ